MSVKTGAYLISFRANGYKTVELPISIQSGLTPIAPVVLEIIPKTVEILLLDKQNKAYPNVGMQLTKVGHLGSMNQVITELHFDQNGKAETPQIEYGDYGLVLISPILDYRKF